MLTIFVRASNNIRLNREEVIKTALSTVRTIDSIKKVREFMFADIEKCLGLAHPPNFLLALGLCCYTEYWGKLLLGRGKHETKINKAAFNAFLYKLDKNYYQSLAKLLAKNRLDIYFNIRCGLAHAYLIEEGKTATIDTGDKGQHGIEYDHENRRYTFWVKVYFGKSVV